ncbi:DUF192 domain-containing protein [Nitrosopumilus ureiphilus]|uniref:DUF192 domain-containing protein n=1 Tax=Nitrosopumilus ureiphilus TaxID=1470067 RepID=A0A7D5M450_9ARCH|nr:DUF192 domain-containing protein [Nitrosopumilus ureiphilus]QLH06232.1 hypothetical protein C5F50_03430 [Nitrosopumilus ureiphilus]
MQKDGWLLTIIIAVLVLGSLQIGIMYDCSLQGKNFSFFDCIEIIEEPSYVQDIATLSIQSDNSVILINVEIADELQKQINGLMFRQNLDWDSGMLFVYDSEKKRSFWMKNTLISLDMLFIDEDFRIIDIKENVPPCIIESCPNYTSNMPAKYVLEVNGGFTMTNNIEIGDLVTWHSKI